MQKNETVIVLDFGGQYNQLIARRVRESGVYCEIVPYTSDIETIKQSAPKGIIFTGGPNSVYDESSPSYSPDIFELGIPILGICYGCQLMAHLLGGNVVSAKDNSSSEYGKTETNYSNDDVLFDGLSEKGISWMSHRDYIDDVPEGFKITATTSACPVAAMSNPERKLYGVQFHPEVNHTEHGRDMLKAFLYDVCECSGNWEMDSFIESTVKEIKEKVGDKGVVLGLSGGVDSSVAAALLSKAIGKQLTCVFVDQGLMRKNEGDFVEETFTKLFDMNFVRINCGHKFISKLKGITDPEEKRHIIGKEFYNVFWKEIRKNYGSGFFAQGTIYPDIVESGTKTAKIVKSHHNVGGLPEDMEFELVEPLKYLFKDEVRACGVELGLPAEMVYRQPFPGPGLGVRCLGAITRDRLHALREADAILREEFDNSGLGARVWQYFISVPDFTSVGVKDGARYMGWPAIIRAVNTIDAMTAAIEEVPYELLHKITYRITHEVEGINRVLYDLTPKPIGTIEWE